MYIYVFSTHFLNDTKEHMILYSIIVNEFLSFLFSKVCFLCYEY